MSKTSLYTPSQALYTKGYNKLADGTQVRVNWDNKSDTIVTCVDSTGHLHFIAAKELSLVKVTGDATIPNWLKPLGDVILTAKRVVYVFNDAILPNHTILTVSDGHIHNPILEDVRCYNARENCFHSVLKANIYIQNYGTSVSTVPKPLASEFKEFTEDHKYMIQLLQEPSRDAVINKVMQGVDMEDYKVFKAPKFFVLMPKDPVDLYLPMIMAHTDIVTSVKHPTDLTLEYDPKLDKFTSPHGLGADDRAGCYAINRILLKHPKKFIVALFDEEEIGCKGSNAFAETKEFIEVNKLASCFISIDRRRGHNGAHQIATYDYDNQELFDAVKLSTGRMTVNGSSTDCKALSTKSYNLPAKAGTAKLACFNMSCGYDNEHTKSESLYFKELQQVVEDLESMIDLAPELWEKQFVATKKVYAGYYGGGYYGNSKHSHSWLDNEITIDKVSYDESDVRTLLWVYQQLTGKAYKFKDATDLCVDPAVSDYVRLSSNCAPEGTFGGTKIPTDAFNRLKDNLWVVTAVDTKTMKLDAMTEDGKLTATNVPYEWLRIVTVSDPLVEA